MSRVDGVRLSLTAALALLAATGIELLLRARGSGDWLFSFSLGRAIGLAVYGLFAGLAALAIVWALLRRGWIAHRSGGWSARLEALPERVRWSAAAFFLVLPALTFLGPWGGPLSIQTLRITVLLGSALAAAALTPERRTGLLSRYLLALLFAASTFAIVKRFILVADYPFKLGWSEGNRLWDYSLYFRWEQYGFGQQTAIPTYLTPGRHGLWGLPFLLPELPIWLARLWDAILWVVPYSLLSWIVVRRYGAHLPPLTQYAALVWSFLFLTLGGIFAPLILSALLVFWLGHPRHTARTVGFVALAGLYAGLSRWTWLLAPAAWAVLLVLMAPERRETQPQRLVQAVVVGLAGVAGGLGSQWIMAAAFPRPDPVFSTSLSHPLLWYRMLPNATNPIGIVPGLLIAVGPLLLLLVWAVRRWQLPWTRLEQSTAALTVLVLFAASLAASAKIGGGSNLHNADMLLLTILLLVAMAVGWRRGGQVLGWPALSDSMRLLAVIAVMVPALDAVRAGGPLRLPDDSQTEAALATIRREATAAAEQGEVLFIDQRQLFTFSQVRELPLEMDYELKDMMNQALGANEQYFERFRRDLERHRFSLIVSDPLPGSLQGRGHQFGEENDAWFTYVAEPLRAYYEPYLVLDQVGAWLLRPLPEDSR